MGYPLFKFEISADAVAWYAAIVSTLAMLILLYGALRDRGRIKINYQKDMQVLGHHPDYDPNKTYVNITVINKGRRPVNITKAGVRVLGAKRKYALLNDSFSTQRNRVLTEAEPTTEFMMEQDEALFGNAWFICVYDATGKVYRKYLHPLLPIWMLYRRLTGKTNMPETTSRTNQV